MESCFIESECKEIKFNDFDDFMVYSDESPAGFAGMEITSKIPERGVYGESIKNGLSKYGNIGKLVYDWIESKGYWDRYIFSSIAEEIIIEECGDKLQEFDNKSTSIFFGVKLVGFKLKGEYRIFAKGAEKYIDVTDGEGKNGTRLSINDKINEKRQIWKFSIQDNKYTITTSLNDRVFDIAGGSVKNGAELIIWNHHGEENQKFKINRVLEDWYSIECIKSKKVLDITGGETKNGTKVIQWEYHGGDNQLFRFDKVES